MKKLIVLNLKQLMDFNDVKKYIKDIKDKMRTDLDIVICPSSLFLPYFSGKYTFKLGAQDIHYENITGEVSGVQLKSLGVTYSIVGHSERKRYLGESNEIINKKIKESLKNNISPIVCVGETKEERLCHKTGEIVIKQLKDYFRGIEFKNDIIIAYEPIWCIGTGQVIKKSDLEEMIVMLKDLIFRQFNVNVKVLYGGSINKNNIVEFDSVEELDGFLIGKASCDSKEIIDILNLVK